MTDRAGQGSQSQRPGRGPDTATVTVRVPITLRKRGGRKRILAPDGNDASLLGPPRQVSTLVKALARAHRWQRMLESGDYGSISELAAAERINSSYISRVLRLTLLSPNTVEAILDGREPASDPTGTAQRIGRGNQWEDSSNRPGRARTRLD